MIDYVNNILPRIKEYSRALNKKELFIDHPWTLIDELGCKQTYIFRRNNELIMSNDGNVLIGSWEILPKASSLLIDRVKDKLLLKQEFIDDAMMILMTDSLNGLPFILINSNIIPDYDVNRYINDKYVNTAKTAGIDNLKSVNPTEQKVHSSVHLSSGDTLQIIRDSGTSLIGAVATINGRKPVNGDYRSVDEIYTIIDGKIKSHTVRTDYIFWVVLIGIFILVFFVWILSNA